MALPSIESSPMDFLDTFVLTTPTASGSVSGSGILAFTDKVGQTAKEDIKNATLFASLASTTKYKVNEDPSAWYQQYFQILQILGFSLQSSSSFSKYIMKSNSMKIDEIVLDILSGLLTEGESTVVKEVMKTIEAEGENGKPTSILSSNSFTDETGGFQVYSCTQSPSGDVTLKAGFFLILQTA